MNVPVLDKTDRVIAGVIVVVFAFFLLYDPLFNAYISATKAHPLVMGFCKFAILATFGECVAARLRTGRYYSADFGVVPKAVVWGFLGMIITTCFVIFATGAPAMLAGMGLKDAGTALSGPLSVNKVLAAFFVSFTMNLLFSPLLMVAHKLTDLHIANHRGRLACMWTRPDMPALFRQIDWNIMWSFVLARTIPLFWLPAHTVTFLLPETFRVLFAAVLGAALGIMLALKK